MGSSVIILVASFLVVANAAKVPPTWKTCRRNLSKAEYAVCIDEAFNGAVSELMVKGAPTLGVPPMNPLKITTLEIGKGGGPVAVEMKFTDLELSNLDSYQVTAFRSDEVEQYKFGCDFKLNKPLIAVAKYELSGKVLVLPIKGKGKCKLELDNFRATSDLAGVLFKKGDGEMYLNVTEFLADFKTDRFHMYFENLFDGNKELGDNMNVFLNENWEIILQELKPAIIEAYTTAFKGVANQIFTKVPWKKLIPPS